MNGPPIGPSADPDGPEGPLRASCAVLEQSALGQDEPGAHVAAHQDHAISGRLAQPTLQTGAADAVLVDRVADKYGVRMPTQIAGRAFVNHACSGASHLPNWSCTSAGAIRSGINASQQTGHKRKRCGTRSSD